MHHKQATCFCLLLFEWYISGLSFYYKYYSISAAKCVTWSNKPFLGFKFILQLINVFVRLEYHTAINS